MFKKLKEMGILGMNRRLGEYIIPYNPRANYPLVDNKIQTYSLAKEHEINQPENYLLIHSYGDLKNIQEKLKNLESFVVKPNRGAMGNGILIVHSANWSDEYDDIRLQTSREEITLQDLKYHISDILSGMYSLNGLPDEVIIQEKLKIHPAFEPYSFKGIPDVRIIVFKGYPVMGMLRLPTKQSRGRANLHQGAVGCGLNMRDGTTCGAVLQNNWIETHPDTGASFSELKVPFWQEILLLASKCYDFTNMGYLGVDLVLDEDKGPLLLEINARPGLSIQVANMTGLEPRLKIIKMQDAKASIEEKVAFSLLNF